MIKKAQNRPMTFGMKLTSLTGESEKVLAEKIGKFGLEEIKAFIQDLNQSENMNRVFRQGLGLNETNRTNLKTFISDYGKRELNMVLKSGSNTNYLNIEIVDQFSKSPERYSILADETDAVSLIKLGITDSLKKYAKTLFGERLMDVIRLKDEAARKKLTRAYNK